MNRTAVKTGSEVDKLLGETRGMLQGIQAARRRTAGRLKKDLARERTKVRSEVRQMLADFHRARKGKGAATPSPGNGEKAKPRAKTAANDRDSLGIKVLTSVENHPEGITMKAVAVGLGVAPVVLSRIFSSLVSGGRVRKEDLKYYPLAK